MDRLEEIIQTHFGLSNNGATLISPKDFEEMATLLISSPQSYKIKSVSSFQRMVSTGIRFVNRNLIQQEQFWDSLTVCSFNTTYIKVKYFRCFI